MPIKPALTRTIEAVDPKDGFLRTALVLDPGDRDCGSVDVVVDLGGGKYVRLCQINITAAGFGAEDEYLIVDVIDVDDHYTDRSALTFPDGDCRKQIRAGSLVSADFRKGG